MKILIIAHYYPPENGAAVMASQRPAAWAKYWSQMGHDIRVLTTQKAAYQTLPSHTENSGIQIEGVSYLLSRPDVSETTNAHPDKLTLNNKLYPQLRQGIVKLRQLLGTGTLLFVSDLWVYPALRRALALYQDWPYDLVVSTYGPPASHLTAAMIRRRLNVFWVADYRDLWHGYDFLITKWPFSVLEKKLEDFSIEVADLITTVSEGFSSTLRKRFPSTEILTFTNGFDLAEIPKVPYHFSGDQKIRLVHTGNIYSHKRDPKLLFQALYQLQQQQPGLSDRLEVLFYGWDLGNLPALAEQYQLQDVVKTPGFIDRSQSLEIQKAADALIYIDWHDPLVEGIIGGKLYEYMFSGRPILGMGATPESAAGQLIIKTKTGVCLGKTVTSTIRVLNQLLQGYSIPYKSKPELIHPFTREGIAKNMLDAIQVRMSYES
ncbi:glycosyltransferase [Acaryochloris sp. 'Moss Beach']|uniref:glycosyltransferase n=1 Tax=Acaryochloris sp. 'Moss Beach' TaxID=2740837 RepID=UPI001F182AFA|nr:glycosyltransferase [Acaryochloris sp. 'Moss Beach']UJB69474.1 glycosyltransferase [Acaryochloris sp. 'Moss Beach']